MRHPFPVSSGGIFGSAQDQLSSQPCDLAFNDESDLAEKDHRLAQTLAGEHVMTWDETANQPNFHHSSQVCDESQCEEVSADSRQAKQSASRDFTQHCAPQADDEPSTNEAGSQGSEVDDLMKVEPNPDELPPPRRNTQKLSPADLERLLTCLSLGLSMRQAATLIGCHQSTLVKKAKRDAELAKQIELARAQARSQPLLQIYQASRTSWRAAAWLVAYLDSRDQRGKANGQQANGSSDSEENDLPRMEHASKARPAQ